MSSRSRALRLTALLALAALLFLRQGAEQTDVAALAVNADRVDSSTDTDRDSASPSPTTAPSTGDLIAALAGDEAVTAPPPPPLPPSPEPLPPWDAKLVDVLPALKARADAGDHVAACHIGLALSACAMSLSYAPSKAELRQLDPSDKEAIDRLAWRSQDFRRPGRDATCVGLDPLAMEERFAYLQQAADAGNGAAMLAYAEGVPLQFFEAMFRHPEWLEAHRQRTPRYVAELIRRGDRFMAFLLSMGNDGMQMSLLGKALEMDELTAATFWYLGRDVLDQPKQAWHGPTPSIERAARERAHALYTRYFEQRPFRSGEFNGRADMVNVEHCRVNP